MTVTDKTGLVILLLLGLSTLSLGVFKEYYYVPLLKTWTEAQTYCRENFVDLATIETVEDWARVRQMIKGIDKFIYIGLHYDINTWRWSIDNTYLYGDDAAKFGEWFVFTTNNQDCVEIVGGILNERSCGDLEKSVCYDESTKKYIAVTVPMTWSSAQSYCRQKYTDLASMRNQQEKEAIMSVTDQSHWWIGLYRDPWRWSHQSDSSLRLWHNGEPNGGGMEDCGCITGWADRDGWNDISCDSKLPFICSVPPMKLVKVVLKVVLKVALKAEMSVDLNDPPVQEAVLSHIENRMRDHGIHQKFRLRWREKPNGKIFTKRDVEL